MSEIMMVSNQLEGLRFTGVDQNPKGIHDTLYEAARDAENLYSAAWELVNGEGDPIEAFTILEDIVKQSRYSLGGGQKC